MGKIKQMLKPKVENDKFLLMGGGAQWSEREETNPSLVVKWSKASIFDREGEEQRRSRVRFRASSIFSTKLHLNSIVKYNRSDSDYSQRPNGEGSI